MPVPARFPSDPVYHDRLPPLGARVRDLGVYERLFHLCALDHPRHFCVAAEIEGPLLPEDLPAAFALLQRRHPLLNVEIQDRAVTDGRLGPAFYTTDRPIGLTLKPLTGADDWAREAERQLVARFDAAPGPLMRATVFHRPGRMQIVLTFHHTIADGLSGAYVMQDLMAALAGQPLGTLPARPSSDTLLVMRPDFVRPSDAKLPQKLDTEALRAVGAETSLRVSRAGPPTIASVALGKTVTSQLLEIARAQGTTLHGALAAAQALSGFSDIAGMPYTIVSPISLREILGVNDGTCGIYIGVSRHVHVATSRAEFWALARQATDEIALARNIPAISSFTKSIMANVPANATPEVAVGLMATRHRDAVISNLGRLPFRQTAGRLRLAAFWGPVYHAQAPHARFVGAATLGGCLRLVETTPADMRPLLDSVRKWLEVAVSLPA